MIAAHFVEVLARQPAVVFTVVLVIIAWACSAAVLCGWLVDEHRRWRRRRLRSRVERERARWRVPTLGGD